MITYFSRFFYKIFKRFFGEHFDEVGFITYSNNIQWFTIARIVSMAISLCSTIVIARLLGPSAFGLFNYVLSIVALFTILSNLGISNILYKQLTLEKEKREEIFGSAFFLNMITATIAITIVMISLIFIRETWYVKSLILLLSLTFVTYPFTLLSFDFLKDTEAKYVTITQIITLLISTISKIAVIYYFNSIAYMIIVLVLENLVAGAIYAYQILRIKKRTLTFRVNRDRVLLIFSLSLPLILYGAFSEIYARIDQIMLKYYLNTAAVGFYSASVRLTELWYMVPNILTGALFPALANAKDDNVTYQKRYDMLLTILAGASIVISIVVFFFRDFLIGLIYGKDFVQSSPILGVYIFSLVGFFLSTLIYQDLFIRHSNKWLVALLPLSTAVLNIIGNIILIPLYGTVGAAIATTVSYNIVPLFFFIIRKL